MSNLVLSLPLTGMQMEKSRIFVALCQPLDSRTFSPHYLLPVVKLDKTFDCLQLHLGRRSPPWIFPHPFEVLVEAENFLLDTTKSITTPALK
jgi:hypothetical protein